MRKDFKISSRALIAVLLIALLPTPAWAYIDPNAGGVLYQIFTPMVASIAVVWIVAKEKVSLLFGRLMSWLGLSRQK
jgi:hypothetical protein